MGLTKNPFARFQPLNENEEEEEGEDGNKENNMSLLNPTANLKSIGGGLGAGLGKIKI